MKPVLGIITYVGLYGIYVEALNRHGLKTDFKRKGSWNKSTRFPYWDNWSYTHLLWGGFANMLKINTPSTFALSFINEFIYEPYRCNKYSSGDTNISYAQFCDPVGHKVADTIYTMLGYVVVGLLKNTYDTNKNH